MANPSKDLLGQHQEFQEALTWLGLPTDRNGAVGLHVEEIVVALTRKLQELERQR